MAVSRSSYLVVEKDCGEPFAIDSTQPFELVFIKSGASK